MVTAAVNGHCKHPTSACQLLKAWLEFDPRRGTYLQVAAKHPVITVRLAVPFISFRPGKPVKPVSCEKAMPRWLCQESCIEKAVLSGVYFAGPQEILASLPTHIKVVDLSADFRLRNVDTYAEW